MKIFKNNEELKALIKDGRIYIHDDIKCDFDIKVEADIKCWNIEAGNINCFNIDAWNIDAGNINCDNINCYNIDALKINYHSSCISRESFKCTSVVGRRNKSIHTCLDGEIEFKQQKDVIEITCKVNGKEVPLSSISEETLNEIKKTIG